MTVAVVVITKDEEANIAACLESVRWADETIVVDADERITDGLRREIQALLAAGPAADIGGYEIPRRNFFYGKWIQGGGLYPDYQLRLFRKTAGRYDDVLLHENFRLSGRTSRLEGPLDHYS